MTVSKCLDITQRHKILNKKADLECLLLLDEHISTGIGIEFHLQISIEHFLYIPVRQGKLIS
jgi:uncharacterized Rmd1/YagE family protein